MQPYACGVHMHTSISPSRYGTSLLEQQLAALPVLVCMKNTSYMTPVKLFDRPGFPTSPVPVNTVSTVSPA